jgi:membrane-associated phospholipid phosphatase
VLETLWSRVRSTSLSLRSTPGRNGSTAAGNNGTWVESHQNQHAGSDAPARSVSLARLVPNILQDQPRVWLFPKEVFEGKHWKPVLIFLAITGGLLLVDPHDPGYFRHTQVFYEFNLIVSGRNAAGAMWAVTLSVLGISIVRQDAYMRHTVFFAFESVIDSEFLTQVLKGIDRRVRPQDVHSYRHFLDSWFRDKGPWYSGPGSFPSGHMIAAMALATIFALRYSERRWVPWTAYGLAVIIGFSRLTLLSHFPSDVFAGGVFGYVISRYVVLRRADSQPAPGADSEERREISHAEALR